MLTGVKTVSFVRFMWDADRTGMKQHLEKFYVFQDRKHLGPVKTKRNAALPPHFGPDKAQRRKNDRWRELFI